MDVVADITTVVIDIANTGTGAIEIQMIGRSDVRTTDLRDLRTLAAATGVDEEAVASAMTEVLVRTTATVNVMGMMTQLLSLFCVLTHSQ